VPVRRHYIQAADGFWDGVLGILKAFVWPAFVVGLRPAEVAGVLIHVPVHRGHGWVVDGG
jgi:hypothetical protein